MVEDEIKVINKISILLRKPPRFRMNNVIATWRHVAFDIPNCLILYKKEFLEHLDNALAVETLMGIATMHDMELKPADERDQI